MTDLPKTADASFGSAPLTAAPARCANCGAVLGGPYCHACGQSAESFERSIGALFVDAFEHLFHADGRLVRTVPLLIANPARLTRDYLAGQRASQTPPLRLFLVVIVLFFFAGGLGEMVHPFGPLLQLDSPAGAASVFAPGHNAFTRAFTDWVNPRLASAASHPREFALAAEGWLHRIAILFLPISTLILSLLFLSRRRRIFMFDHAIFSMHSLSFMGLLFTLVTLISIWAPLRGLAVLLAWAAPIHLFSHLRGVYGVTVLGALVRMLLLFAFSILAVAVLLAGVAGLGLSGMGTA
jgi:hypothetical protein